MAATSALAMVSLGCILLFTKQVKVSYSPVCSSFTENGWLNADPTNRICFKYYNKTSTWWEAKMSCEQKGLFLARPDGESINRFLEKFGHPWKGFKFWIGGINQEDSGWKWTNGDKMDYTDFQFFSGTLNRIISFFRKTTSCIMYGQVFWVEKSCDELAPYLCQSGRNTTLTAMQPLDGLSRTQISDSSTKFCYQNSVSTRRPACFVFFEERLTWWDANKTCQEQNMTLVIVRDRVMNKLMETASTYTIISFWIGAINKDGTGWKWGNGEDMLYTDFNKAVVTLGQLFKQTLCGVFYSGRGFFSGWGKYDCDSFYPFVCELSQSSDATPPEKLEISEQTTSPGWKTAKTKNRKRNKQRIFKVQKVVGGQLNPKLIHAGFKRMQVFEPFSCCRLCSSEFGCELVNYCEMSRSCVLYGNFDSSVKGGVTSEPGCSVYVAMEKEN